MVLDGLGRTARRSSSSTTEARTAAWARPFTALAARRSRRLRVVRLARKLRPDGGAPRGHRARARRRARLDRLWTATGRTTRPTSRVSSRRSPTTSDVVNGWLHAAACRSLAHTPPPVADRELPHLQGDRGPRSTTTAARCWGDRGAPIARELRLYGEQHRFIPALAAEVGARVRRAAGAATPGRAPRAARSTASRGRCACSWISRRSSSLWATPRGRSISSAWWGSCARSPASAWSACSCFQRIVFGEAARQPADVPRQSSWWLWGCSSCRSGCSARCSCARITSPADEARLLACARSSPEGDHDSLRPSRARRVPWPRLSSPPRAAGGAAVPRLDELLLADPGRLRLRRTTTRGR